VWSMSLGYLKMVFYISAHVKYVENYTENLISSFCPRFTFSASADKVSQAFFKLAFIMCQIWKKYVHMLSFNVCQLTPSAICSE